MASFLLYGSYGYTGSLIAQEAVRRGLKPILAGRNAAELKLQAEKLGLSYRVFDLIKPSETDSAMGEYLGHSNIQINLDTYGHVLPDDVVPRPAHPSP